MSIPKQNLTQEQQRLLRVCTSTATETAIASALQEMEQSDRANNKAAADPLPGPAKDAFKVFDAIQVGTFNVRPFYDGDIELLATINHPFSKVVIDGISGNADNGALDTLPRRGADAWLLYWVLTRPRKEVVSFIRNRTATGCCQKCSIPSALAEMRILAEDEFGDLSLGPQVELFKAVIKQMGNYFSTVVGHGAKKEGENPSEAASQMESAGS